MKVILLEDIKDLGKKNEVVEVKDSYARNFIIPRGKGVEATGKTLNDLKLRVANDEKNAAARLAEAKDLAGKLASAPIVIPMKVGEGDRTFGAVTTKEIAQAIEEQLGSKIDKKKIEMDGPIKQAGETKVALKLFQDVSAELKVNVTVQ